MTNAPTSALGGQVLAQRFADAAISYARPRPSFNAVILLGFDQVCLLVRVCGGIVTGIEKLTRPLQSWDFSIRGSERAWLAYWQRTPTPGWHDILALNKRREMCIEGNLHPLMANLQQVKDLLAAPREQQ